MTVAARDGAHSMRGLILFWATLAALALAYLAALALKPELVAAPASRVASAMNSLTSLTGVASLSRAATGNDIVAPTEAVAAVAEIQTLQQTVAQLKADLADMKAIVAASEEREKALAERLASIERQPMASPRAAIVTGALPAMAEMPLAAPAAAREPERPDPVSADRVIEARTTEPPSLPPAKGSGVRKAAAAPAVTPEAAAVSETPVPAPARKEPPPKKVAAASSVPAAPKPSVPSGRAGDAGPIGAFTASVTPAPGAPEPAPAPAAGVGHTFYGVKLASGPSVESLRLSWDLLSARHAIVLNGLQPRYTEPDRPGATMSLMAGPMPTSEEAANVCANLRARRVSCAVVPFGGQTM